MRFSLRRAWPLDPPLARSDRPTGRLLAHEIDRTIQTRAKLFAILGLDAIAISHPQPYCRPFLRAAGEIALSASFRKKSAFNRIQNVESKKTISMHKKNFCQSKK